MLTNAMPATEDDKYHISADSVNADERIKVLNHFDSFGIFDRWGNIQQQGKMVHGIYHEGTRFINQLVLLINNEKPLLLSSTIKENNDILSVDLTNPFLQRCNIPENSVHISRSQFMRNNAYYEKITCIHFGEQNCSFELSLLFDGDFNDIFEIRGVKRKVNKPPVSTHHTASTLAIQYHGLDDIPREAQISFTGTLPSGISSNRATFNISLVPQQRVEIQYAIFFKSGADARPPLSFEEAELSIQQEFGKISKLFTAITTSNEQFNHWLTRSKSDLLSLLSQTTYGMYPYAGVPWYNTAFGRDGIITAMETLWAAPEISRDVLWFLANKQAGALIPEKDAEPGKILHETRLGEMANTGEIPFKEYYGTIDATPLFIMLAGMYYERTGDRNFIRLLWPHIKAALIWINDYGDIDGDGFVEYKNKAENGLANQGWKDSFDSVMYADGELAEAPIALCEVQGYVYAAKSYAAKLANMMGEPDLSVILFVEADQLKQRFNEQFWDEELQCYVLALDAQKRPCRVVSSNAGHCLFTRIAHTDKAAKLAKTLLHKNSFAGWGIRTLSAAEKRYNPMSYHNGSIWPHDNALIAYGFSLYDLNSEASIIMQAVFEASLYIDLQRMPELYCGFERRAQEGPTAYPVACSPQAWSVAVVFMLLQSCFKIEINAIRKTVYLNQPQLPAYLGEVTVMHLMLNGEPCSFRLSLHAGDVMLHLLQKPSDWELLIRK
ncbi:amylo-alpha-1,6-glucosidase [Deminuibacter soli]|uniref:Amylo-alpha-1,6-glucosidase n=1 Tax=Deminuibacter soli TaxID=2291815 RepID=A0A3E1NJZ8_9BACT|nr:glycogen debranching N-terminal domain-containing protein [Deminuibacter soli]RFM28252.1 amylo-alpha-1,6-glucosidase [Deminuibacter soli]